MTASLTFATDDGSAETVRYAVDEGDSLPGTAGFAGEIDGQLVRDVLGRVPLYVELHGFVREPSEDGLDELPPLSETLDRDDWSYTPQSLEQPVAVPAGTIGSTSGFTRRWTLPEPDPVADHDRVLEELDAAICRSTTIGPSDDVGVAFSGGVDSALLAALLDGPLYVVGFPDSHDVAAAREAALAMGRSADLHVRELSLDTVERAVPVVAREIDRTNPMDVAIGISQYLVARAAAEDGIDTLVFGQGADELFGGYEKVHRLDHRVEAETIRGAVREQLATIPSQLSRDVLAVRAGGTNPVTPYLHDDVVARALELPTDLFGTDATRKRALRLVARRYLPDSIATREKKAFQYGSLVSRELDRLARQAGYKRRMDDHVERYVTARLDDR